MYLKLVTHGPHVLDGWDQSVQAYTRHRWAVPIGVTCACLYTKLIRCLYLLLFTWNQHIRPKSTYGLAHKQSGSMVICQYLHYEVPEQWLPTNMIRLMYQILDMHWTTSLHDTWIYEHGTLIWPLKKESHLNRLGLVTLLYLQTNFSHCTNDKLCLLTMLL